MIIDLFSFTHLFIEQRFPEYQPSEGGQLQEESLSGLCYSCEVLGILGISRVPVLASGAFPVEEPCQGGKSLSHHQLGAPWR